MHLVVDLHVVDNAFDDEGWLSVDLGLVARCLVALKVWVIVAGLDELDVNVVVDSGVVCELDVDDVRVGHFKYGVWSVEERFELGVGSVTECVW